MAYVESNGARIYWTEQGRGEPLLLIMGLGYPHEMWYRVAPVLAERYHVIMLDNRGVGRSDVPPGPYPIATMAADARAVLDAAGIDRAHVLGVSMGGMIAQEFTLQNPQRVAALVLGCTACGGPKATPAGPEVIVALMARDAARTHRRRPRSETAYAADCRRLPRTGSRHHGVGVLQSLVANQPAYARHSW